VLVAGLVIPGKSAPQASRADQGSPHLFVQIENTPQFAFEKAYFISNALLAELPEPREILAHEGRAYPRTFSQFLRRHQFLISVRARLFQYSLEEGQDSPEHL